MDCATMMRLWQTQTESLILSKVPQELAFGMLLGRRWKGITHASEQGTKESKLNLSASTSSELSHLHKPLKLTTYWDLTKKEASPHLGVFRLACSCVAPNLCVTGSPDRTAWIAWK